MKLLGEVNLKTEIRSSIFRLRLTWPVLSLTLWKGPESIDLSIHLTVTSRIGRKCCQLKVKYRKWSLDFSWPLLSVYYVPQCGDFFLVKWSRIFKKKFYIALQVNGPIKIIIGNETKSLCCFFESNKKFQFMTQPYTKSTNKLVVWWRVAI